MRATSKLRSLLATGKTLFVPGCYNALSAKILETVGFPALQGPPPRQRASLRRLRSGAAVGGGVPPAEEMDKYADSVGHQPARS